ncbi:uncharacterized protein LOC113524302 isoform X2 [Pangasianodon hypophthalmus]|uniref:uncharacterized protein LOC113524302 isoform X2 n=1 Tax=Pangasianodon hypophthalmus TaxID=310915 RepID=UPI002306F356|nr:uncharacterized protein LOC113524302 isoform X2 [Pangasianodon hypophthalmus]
MASCWCYSWLRSFTQLHSPKVCFSCFTYLLTSMEEKTPETSTVMEPGTLLRRILLIIIFLRVSASSSAAVTVNGSARLSCNKPCSGEVKCVYAKGSEILVIKCKQGSCVEGDAFKNRTELTFSEDGCCLQLNNIQYSDDGMYIFSCDKSELCRKSLDVLAPVPVHAAVGENVTIPCYAHTNKIIADRDIMYRCEKDGELVVALQQGNVLYGPGFDVSRVSVSLDKYKHGDLSLTISNVQPSDAGTYRCTHRHEEPVQPEAFTLTITTTLPAKDVTNCSTAGREQMTWPWWGVLVENIVIVLLGVVYVLFRKWQRKKAQKQSSSEQASNSSFSDDP